MKQQKDCELNQTGKKILSTVGRSRYDTEAIHLVKDKQILAWILHDCVEEFAGMTREEIIPYIEDVYSGAVSVEPGLTNTVVFGDPTESKIPGEGVITYDVRFKARIPHCDNPLNRLLFDTELQNSEALTYDIESRADFYVGRMLSEQMGQNVTGKDYSGLQRVYSIWICTSTPLVRANSLIVSSMEQKVIHGTFPGNGKDDMMRIIYIRLPDENLKGKPKQEPTELMTVLSTLFSTKITAEKKLEILQEHGISVTNEVRGRVNTMCNLSEGIFNSGYEKGRQAERQRADEAEKRANEAYIYANAIEQRANAADQRAHAADQRANAAEQRVRELEILLAQRA